MDDAPKDTVILPTDAWFAPMSRWKQRKERSKIVLLQLMLDYAENTTLHGLRYTTEKGRLLFEKLFWLLTFSLSLGCALYLTHKVWHKWQSSPVIVSFSEKLIPVEMIPFPSLTICPQVKVKPSVYNFTANIMYFYQDVFKNMDLSKIDDLDGHGIPQLRQLKGLKDFLDAALLCPMPYYLDAKYLTMLQAGDTTDHTTVENIRKVSPSKDYLHKCFWLGKEKNCTEIFDTVLTEEGVCFNFNGMAGVEIFRTENLQNNYTYNDAKRRLNGWNPFTGYMDFNKKGARYPYAGKYNKRSPTFEVILQTPSTENDLFCNVVNKGFKVYIQHPASHPQSSVYSYALLPNQVSALAVKVNVMNTSKSLMSYSSEVRQCFFAQERYLRYFRIYTSTNCMLECMANYTLKQCGCVSFYMPHFNSHSICTVKHEKCLRDTRVSEELLNYIDKNCTCLPNCNYITYEPEILKTQFDYKTSVFNLFEIIGKTTPKELENFEYSKLEVYYKDPKYVSIVRSELFGLTDFIANIGGLLGLFLGFSILSFVEIVYFFTIRYGLALKEEFTGKKEARSLPQVHSIKKENKN